ncbi:hypothetical protein XENOCAPTIV_001522, partial [Xenoophorus captivus]
AFYSRVLSRLQCGGDAAPLTAALPDEESVSDNFSLGKQSVSVDEPACMFCFFSLPTAGHLYSLRGGVEHLSAYHMEVCALRMQLFIGLRSVCAYGRHVILLSTADTETPEETERHTQRRGLQRYAENNPQGLSLRHLLGEAHLLLRSCLLESSERQQGGEEPSMLVSVCASPCMMNVDPAATLQMLQHLEDTSGVSVPLTITMATMMLRLGNMARHTELMERHAEMLLVYGFIEEPRLLLHGGGGDKHTQVCPTALARQLADSQPGLLVAGMVALHENSKVQLEQADHIFKVCVPGALQLLMYLNDVKLNLL